MTLVDLCCQLNVDTQEEMSYIFPEGMFPQEPIFVERPDPQAEDDGVLLVQGVDGGKEKGEECGGSLYTCIHLSMTRRRALNLPCNVWH